MNHRTLICAAILSAGLVTGCAQKQASDNLELCEDPRPQICTREYNPVCATLNDGSRKTYATGCTACSDQAVKGWLAGECS